MNITGIRYYYAEVAKLADALRSGRSEGNLIRVQVPSSAQIMAIKPKCDSCKKELKEFGAILLSPPKVKNKVHKFHLCKSCYGEILKGIKAKK